MASSVFSWQETQVNTKITRLNSLFVFCCQIRSDKDRQAKVEYYLSGPGASKPPYNLFVVDHDTGFVRITDVVDRETYPFFNVSLSLHKVFLRYCTDWNVLKTHKALLKVTSFPSQIFVHLKDSRLFWGSFQLIRILDGCLSFVFKPVDRTRS